MRVRLTRALKILSANRPKCAKVENSVNPIVVAHEFAAHFSEAYKLNNVDRAFCALYTYYSFPLTEEHDINTKLVYLASTEVRLLTLQG